MPKKKVAKREVKKGKISAFKKEFRKSTSTAIIAAFSFLIALAWRDAITKYIEKLTTLGPAQSGLVSALIVTFIGVIGIMITTKILSEEEQ